MDTNKIFGIIYNMVVVAPKLTLDNTQVIERLKDLAIDLFSALDE